MAPHRIYRECLKGVHTTATNIHFKCTKAQEKISGTDLRANSSTVADCSQKPLRRHTENFKNLLDNVVQQLSEVPLQEQLFTESADKDAQKLLRNLSVSCCVLQHFLTMSTHRHGDRVWLCISVDKRKMYCKLLKP